MTVYGTKAGMIEALGDDVLKDIADHDGDGSVDDDVVARGLARASSFADTYLSAYTPLTVVPDALERAIYDIAAQQIRLGRGQGTDDSKLAYDNALSWLKMIALGQAVLIPADPAEDVIDPGDPEMTSDDRIWTRATARRVL